MKKYTLSAVFLMLSLLLLLSSLLSSCAWLIPGYAELLEPNEHDLEHACCAYAVPGMFDPDVKGLGCDLIELDTQGRRLIRYERYNEILDDFDAVLVICQKMTKNQVFFYEDICYTSIPSDVAEGKELEAYVSEGELIASFKAQNDWNMPLNETKMSRRTVTEVTLDSYIQTDREYDSGDLIPVLEHAMQEDVHSIIFQDKDERGHEIHYFDMEDGRQYLVMVSHDENAYDMIRLAFFEIENGELDREAYAAFKKANGWVYGP